MENTKKIKKSRKFVKIFLCILALIILALGALAVWQRENIAAFIKAQNTSQEGIADEIADSKAVVRKEIEKYNIPIQRDFTLEEEEQIRKGTLSVEEAVRRITSASPEDSGEQGSDLSSGNTAEGDSQGVQELTKEQQIVTDYLTELYTLKAYYIGQLGVVETDLKSQYKAANGSTKNASAIAQVVQNNMGSIITMESECDNKVYALLDNMRDELLAIGADTSIVDIAEDSYIKEKSLRKSYYLSQYN